MVLEAGCSNDDDPAAPGISSDILVDEGNVGLVVDVRRVFKKGYIPTTGQVRAGGNGSSHIPG